MPKALEAKLKKRVRNKEYDKAYTIKWRKEHPERIKELSLKSYYKHKDERRKYYKDKYNNDPEYKAKHKASNRKSLYGITPEQYDILLEVQNGVCATCRKPQENKNLFVDHNHQTGKIRGLLCQKCNSAIGLVGESTEILEKLIDYLKNYA